MADMDKLMEFLQKEVPSNAGDLNSSINNTLEIIERTRAALASKVTRLFQDGESEFTKFTKANRELADIENFLKDFICDVQIEPSVTPQIDIEGDKNQKVFDKPDYDAFRVDDKTPHYLYEDFTNKRPVAFSLEGTRYPVRDWNKLLIMVCEILYKKNSKLFQSFIDDPTMQGRTRTYFSTISSNVVDPKKINGTNIYVMTHNNGKGTCSIVERMIERYDIPITGMEIFLRADYSPLHESDDSENKDVKKN